MKKLNKRPLIISITLILINCYLIYAQDDFTIIPEGMNMQSSIPKGTSPVSSSELTENQDFTGNVSLSITLVSLSDFNIQLNYNSEAISNKARSENHYAPSGPVGFGWQLLYGSISAEINNNTDTSDDKYYYKGSDASFELQEAADGSFYIPDYKPWKITRIMNGGIIEGWEVVKEDGTIFRFGNYNDSTENFSLEYNPTSATRFLLGYKGVVSDVGTALYDSLSYIPYQWDISNVEYISGKRITIFYQPVKAAISLGTDSSSLRYTRESYPLKMFDNEGGEIDFILDTLLSSEYYNYPHKYQQNLFGTKYLDSIKIKKNNNIIKKISFSYSSINVFGPRTTKRFLSSIKFIGSSGDTIPSYKFDYYTSAANTNAGALKSLVDPKGSKITYTYKSQTLSTNVQLSASVDIDTVDYYDLVEDRPADNGLVGKDFVVVRTSGNIIKVYRQGAEGWYLDTKFPIQTAYYSKVYNDYVLLKQDTVLFAIKRTLGGWKTYNVNNALREAGDTLGEGGGAYAVGLGNNYFVVEYNIIGNETYFDIGSHPSFEVSIVSFTSNGLKVYNSSGRYYEGNIYLQQTAGTRHVTMRAFCGENYMVLASASLHSPNTGTVFSHFRFSPTTGGWEPLILNGNDFIGNDPFDLNQLQPHRVYINKNFVILTLNNRNLQTIIKVYHKDGNSSVLSLVDSVEVFRGIGNITLAENYYAYTYLDGSTDNPDQIEIRKWNGEQFTSSNKVFSDFFDDDYYPDHMYLSAMENRLIVSWVSHVPEAPQIKSGYITYSTAIDAWSDGIIINEKNSITDCPRPTNVPISWNTFIEVVTPGKECGDYPANIVMYAYQFHGDSVSYTTIDTIITNHAYLRNWLWQPGGKFFAFARVAGKGAFILPDSLNIYTLNSPTNGEIKFNGNPKSVVVDKRIISAGAGNDLVHSYSFKDGVFNQYLTPEYRNVTDTLPGNAGSIKTAYYTYLDSVSGGINYMNLEGKPYRIIHYNTQGSIVKEKLNKWTTVPIDTMNGVFFNKLLADTIHMDNLSSIRTYNYNDKPYLQLSKITETNSNGIKRITRMTYPEDYPNTSSTSGDPMVRALDSMKIERHIINAVIEKWIMQDSAGTQKLLSAQLTKYKGFHPGQILPEEQFGLRATSPLSIAEFDSSTSTTSTFSYSSNYVLQKIIDEYDSSGNIERMTNASGTITNYKYVYNNSRMSVEIKNAGNTEFNFTDFEDETIGDWLVWNNSSSSSSDTSHTGIHSRYFSGTSYSGIYKQFQANDLNTSGKYIVSGWVKTNGTYPRLLWFIRYNNGSSYSYPASVQTSGTGDWEYLEMTLDLSSYSNITFINLYALNGTSSSYYNECLWDDLRFYPSDAEMTTMTYDPVTLQITSKSDAGNQPTYYEYDGLQRLVKIFKMKDGKKQLVNEFRTQYSRNYSTDFDSTMPNTIESIFYDNAENYSDFSSSTDWSIVGSATFNYIFDNKTTVKMHSPSSSWYDIHKQVDGKHGIARIDFYPTQTSGGAPIVIAFGSTGHRFGVMYTPSTQKFGIQIYASGWKFPHTFSLDAPINHWYTVEIVKFTDGKACAYVYPKGEGRIYKPGYYYADSVYIFPSNWAANIYSYISNSTYYLSDFYYGEPKRNIVFSDGLGRKIQEQSQNSDSMIVVSTITYNENGKVDKVYKPYEKFFYIHQRGGKYDPSYASNVSYYYNSGMGDYRYSTSTESYLYSQKKYSSDPLNRIIEAGFPGDTWRIGSGHSITYDYSSNTSLKQYITSITDENNVETNIYTDIFGNKVKTIKDVGGLDLTTSFNYDIADNLISTVDPSSKTTTYSYNTLNQLTQKTSPDFGVVRYLYDKRGNQRFIKDANHGGLYDSLNSVSLGGSYINSHNEAGSFTMSQPGRIQLTGFLVDETGDIEISVKKGNALLGFLHVYDPDDEYKQTYVFLPKGIYSYNIVTTGSGSYQALINCSSGYEFIYNKYDDLNRLTETGEYLQNTSTSGFTQSNADDAAFPQSYPLPSKKYFYNVSSTDVLAAGQRNLQGKLSYAESYTLGSWSYTNFYSYDDLGNIEWTVHKWFSGYNAKEIYTRDLQGKVIKKEFVDNSSKHMYYFYTYDELGRLASVSTDTVSTGANKVTEGQYKYYASNKVKRLQLGEAQGVDYVYNTRDWLQMINHQNIVTSQDPGHDGTGGTGVAYADKFGEVIGYNIIEHIGSSQSAAAQYNGNISWQMYQMSGVTTQINFDQTSLVGDTYSYDNANRLTGSSFGGYASSAWQSTDNYDVSSINYDDVGNISSLIKNDGDGTTMDNLTYHYQSGKNKLNYISDTAPSNVSTADIDNQSSNNYLYDNNGNMIADNQNNIDFILYDIFNLPVEVYVPGRLNINYDENGQKILTSYEDDIKTYYVNSPAGENEEVVKDYGPIIFNILGNDNIGQVYRNGSTLTRYYYLKDHLGSIKMRIKADGSVDSYDDYYPYGMVMSGRSQISSADARYKFTGKERDAEINYDYFGARYYDYRIGRWLQADPLAEKYPSWSPYNYALCNPLRNIDPNGMLTEDQIEEKKTKEEEEKERRKRKLEILKEDEKEGGFWGGFFNGIKEGFLSTIKLLSEAGSIEGAEHVTNSVANEYTFIAQNPGDLLQMGKSVDYLLNIRNMSNYELGHDLGFYTEKSMEMSLIRFRIYPEAKGFGFDFWNLGRTDLHFIRLGGKKTGREFWLPHIDSRLFKIKHWPWNQIDKKIRGIN